MSKHNYSQYSKRKPSDVENKPKQTVTNVKPAEVKMEVEPVAPVETTDPVVLMGPIETAPITSEAPETVIGTVVNCNKLNVRSKPSITGEVICVLNAKSEVKINKDKLDIPEWYSVCTATGFEGYCMRKFINTRL